MGDHLPDVLAPGLRVVFCGTAAGTASSRAGAYYAGPGNKFWRTLEEVQLTPRRLAPEEFSEVLNYGIGLTDLCKSAAGSDVEVARHGFDVRRLRAQIETYRPAVLAFNGMKGGQVAVDATAYGQQRERWASTAIWVLPSTSGAANRYWDVEHWRALAATLG